jgi:hypothetical protein
MRTNPYELMMILVDCDFKPQLRERLNNNIDMSCCES